MPKPYPLDMSAEQWNECLVKMADAFEYYANRDDTEEDNYDESVEEGLILFAERYNDIWD